MRAEGSRGTVRRGRRVARHLDEATASTEEELVGPGFDGFEGEPEPGGEELDRGAVSKVSHQLSACPEPDGGAEVELEGRVLHRGADTDGGEGRVSSGAAGRPLSIGYLTTNRLGNHARETGCPLCQLARSARSADQAAPLPGLCWPAAWSFDCPAYLLLSATLARRLLAVCWWQGGVARALLRAPARRLCPRLACPLACPLRRSSWPAARLWHYARGILLRVALCPTGTQVPVITTLKHAGPVAA